MGDSDDEFDRRGRGRDKFRGERNYFQRRDDRRGGADDKWVNFKSLKIFGSLLNSLEMMHWPFTTTYASV